MSELPSQSEMIEILWARSEIERVMLNFGHALDTGDWALYRGCFADRFRVDFERLTGQPEVWVDADLWTRFAEIFQRPLRRHHQYSNFNATIDGNKAEAIIYMLARHWRATDLGSCEYTQVGWYKNSFEKLQGQWKITRLSHTFQWVNGNNGLIDLSDPALTELIAEIFNPQNRVTV